jgi:hypothetical protein
MAGEGHVDFGLFRIPRRGPSRQMMSFKVNKMAGPVKKFQAGGISCSLWENEIQMNGEAKAVLKATVERRYKDRNGEWKSSNSYSRNEIPLVIHALEQAFSYMLQKRGTEDGKVEEELVE